MPTSNFYYRLLCLQRSDNVLELNATTEMLPVRKTKITLEELISLARRYPEKIKLPDPLYRDLPPLFNIDRERRWAGENLVAERM